MYKTDLGKAMKCHKKSVEIALKTRETNAILCAYYKLVMVYNGLEMFREMLKLIEEMLKIVTHEGNINYQGRYSGLMPDVFHILARQHKHDQDMYKQYMKKSEQYQRKCAHLWDQLFVDLGDQRHCKLAINDRYHLSRAFFSIMGRFLKHLWFLRLEELAY